MGPFTRNDTVEMHDVDGQALWGLWDFRTVEKLTTFVIDKVSNEHKCFFGESDETKLQTWGH